MIKTRFVPPRSLLRPRLGLILIACVLGGCATPQRVPLSADTPAPINGIVGLRQQEIATTIDRSNITAATGGGLIFALIDAGINNSRGKKAEDAVSPIRDALITYQPGDVLAAALREQFGARPEFAVSSVEVRQITDNQTVAKWVAESAAGAVLFVDAAYELLPNFEGATVKARVSLHRPKAAKTAGVNRPGLPPSFYFNEFASTVRIAGAETVGTRDGAIVLWTNDDGAVGRAVLDHAFHEIIAMLAYDLDRPAPANNALYKEPGSERRMITPPSKPHLRVQGYVEQLRGLRVWVRLPTGELVARERT